MTTRDVYVGELGAGDALDWGGEPRTGNLPTRIGPFFPGYGATRNPHETLIHFIDSGVLKGRKVDWGAYAAKITTTELKLFSENCYGPRVPKDVVAFIASLDAARSYALVACEI